jgi:hypothetical protein
VALVLLVAPKILVLSLGKTRVSFWFCLELAAGECWIEYLPEQ